MSKNQKLENIEYSVQGHNYKLKQILTIKPNLGTYKFILKNNLIAQAIDSYCDKAFKTFLIKSFVYYINLIQDIRNETVHSEQPKREDVDKLRNKIIGVADVSIMLDLTKARVKYLAN